VRRGDPGVASARGDSETAFLQGMVDGTYNINQGGFGSGAGSVESEEMPNSIFGDTRSAQPRRNPHTNRALPGEANTEQKQSPLQQVLSAMPKTSVLYSEILHLLATLLARSAYETTIHILQRLNSHSNQWFNLGYICELLNTHVGCLSCGTFRYLSGPFCTKIWVIRTGIFPLG
jgi:hypothetical protein